MTLAPTSSRGSAGVTSISAADASIVVAGTTTPTIATGTLDAIATAQPPAAAVALNAKKITGLANGTAASDAAAFGQIPAALPPNGAAGGDLTSTYPNPTIGANKLVGSYHEAIAQPAIRQGIGLNGRGLLCENLTQAAIVNNQAYVSQAATFLGNLGIINGDTVNGLVMNVITAASGTAPTGAYVGLYSAAGTQLAVSNNLNSDTAYTSTGLRLLPFSAAYTAVADQAVYAAFVINGTWSVTSVKFGAAVGGATFLGAQLAGKQFMNGTQTGQTTLPSPTATIASNSAPTFWVGLY